MIPDLRNISNDFSIVDQLSIVTFSGISSLLLLLFARSKRSKHSVCLSQNDFLILLALFWCQISPSLKVAIVSKKSQLCLHFDVGQCAWHVERSYIGEKSPMHVALNAGVNPSLFMTWHVPHIYLFFALTELQIPCLCLLISCHGNLIEDQYWEVTCEGSPSCRFIQQKPVFVAFLVH